MLGKGDICRLSHCCDKGDIGSLIAGTKVIYVGSLIAMIKMIQPLSVLGQRCISHCWDKGDIGSLIAGAKLKPNLSYYDLGVIDTMPYSVNIT